MFTELYMLYLNDFDLHLEKPQILGFNHKLYHFKIANLASLYYLLESHREKSYNLTIGKAYT